eukprot:TRINITY_DN27390_c0_g1_i1.p1 TRINITY_DN27390_c0_g1~~TRINITY_DN27390_c0_g1_i1.p1  ORF type:complete len:313 (+),score=32.90 TRINITY_DN27390_c0_g1_i1:42-941(+)
MPEGVGAKRHDAVAAPAPIAWRSLFAGSAMELCKITTLGQPFKVLKTHMAAERHGSLRDACRVAYSRGGLRGFYQGLLPWGWLECGTKGAVLMVTQNYTDYALQLTGAPRPLAAGMAGMVGGLAQSYTVMGVTTFMTTLEVTRAKGSHVSGTLALAREVVAKEGFAGMYRGVNALALRQATNWGSRFAITRATGDLLGRLRHRELGTVAPASERILSSAVGGALACWNNPLEVIRVEQQAARHVASGERLSMAAAARCIYADSGVRGFSRGLAPRMALSMWATVCMIAGGDSLKAWLAA